MKYTPEELGQFLQNIIDRHREDLSILLKEEYNITEVTPANLLLLYEAYGDQFLLQMYALDENVFEGSILDHAEGDSLLTKAINIFNAGKTAVNDIKAAVKGPAPLSPEALKTEVAEEEEPKAGFTTKKILLIGLGVVVVLFIVSLIIKKSK
ncbi:MAG: hypothetical protein WAU36_12035 [Cyclobacteriaceae bacterium]